MDPTGALLLALLILWITLALACGAFAASRGLRSRGYFLLSLLLSPVVAVIAAVWISHLAPRE